MTLPAFPPRIRLAPDLEISRMVTGLWQVADMERSGRTLDPEKAASDLVVALNKERAAAKKPPLKVNAKLHDAATRVVEVLAKSGGNKVKAAKALGISRRSLYRLIQKYGLGEAGPAE